MTKRGELLALVEETDLFNKEQKLSLMDAIYEMSDELVEDLINEIKGYNQRTKDRQEAFIAEATQTLNQLKADAVNQPDLSADEKNAVANNIDALASAIRTNA
ncbi:MAG: hypothetical protein Fur003_3220 [Candidatus Dojkabacteria bacterium]